MKERPILFSAPMVRALLSGSKTQTRRIVKNLTGDRLRKTTRFDLYQQNGCLDTWASDSGWAGSCPYGQPGDRLWVRETWLYVGPGSGSDLPSYVEERKDPANHLLKHCWHRATFEPVAANNYRWTPSIHMNRWASRINLEITDVRVERIKQISEADCYAEGIDTEGDDYNEGGHYASAGSPVPAARYAFNSLWRRINGDESWDANPWVWVIEFKTGISSKS